MKSLVLFFLLTPFCALSQLPSEQAGAGLHKQVKLQAPPAAVRQQQTPSEAPVPPAVMKARRDYFARKSAGPNSGQAVLPSASDKKPHALYRKPKRKG